MVAEPFHNDSGVAGMTGDDVAVALRSVEAALVEVRTELANANERAAARERVIDRLHEENQRLRTGERQLLLRPIVVDLYRLRADLLRQAPTLPASITAEQVGALLESFAYSVEQALERCGVHPIRPAPGDEFDPRQHRATGIAPAGDLGQDGRVAEVLSDGYVDSIDGRVLTPAEVRLARWTPPAGPPSDQADEDHPNHSGPPAHVD